MVHRLLLHAYKNNPKLKGSIIKGGGQVEKAYLYSLHCRGIMFINAVGRG
jgi:hypothetical protein